MTFVLSVAELFSSLKNEHIDAYGGGTVEGVKSTIDTSKLMWQWPTINFTYLIFYTLLMFTAEIAYTLKVSLLNL